MIRRLEQVLETHWKSWFGAEAPGRFQYMKIIDEAASDEEVTFLVFVGRERIPRIIARLSRQDPAATSPRKEDSRLNHQSSREEAAPEIRQELWSSPIANGWSLSIGEVSPGSLQVVA